MTGMIVDLFAGGGGASVGVEAAMGRPVDVAINHNAVALKVHADNHPHTQHWVENVWHAKPRQVTKGRRVELLWASPDCTHFSIAKGAKPRDKNIRSLADVVIDWARDAEPDLIGLENVREFLTWGPLDDDGYVIEARKGEEFRRWRRELEALGYFVDFRVLNAADFGAPTSRRRLILGARRDGRPIRWPTPTHGRGLLPYRTAAECIDWSIPCPSIFERERPLVDNTLRRIAHGIKRFVIDNPHPYILEHEVHGLVASHLVQTGYGEREGQDPRAMSILKPLGTIVAGGGKQALVAAFLSKHFGGVVGQGLMRPTSTITARDHHALTAATLVKFRGTSNSADIVQPLPTLTAGGNHIAEVRAFLVAYFGNEKDGQSLHDPMRTVTTKDRLGLVTVHGVDYQIVDIGMRMLRSHEKLAAQFGRFAPGYDLSGAVTETAKGRLIGNSAPPELVEAFVAAQYNGRPMQLELVA